MKILPILLLTLACSLSVKAQTVFDVGSNGENRVIELPMDVIHTNNTQSYYVHRGFHYNGGYSVTYLINVLPGEYTLDLSYRSIDINRRVVVSLFDRWPYDPLARSFDLPMGPTVRTMPKKIEYRWSIGVSPLSTSTMLYIVVEVPSAGFGFDPFPHSLFIMSPASNPFSSMVPGVTFLTGPTDLVLTNGQATVSYVVEQPESANSDKPMPVPPIPGDLVRNGWFRDGLNYWNPHRNYTISNEVQSFSLQDQSLKLSGSSKRDHEGVLQKIDADVTGCTSLILSADVRVTKQAMGGTGPEGKDAPVAISIGYEDTASTNNLKDTIFWKGFYTLEPQQPNKAVNGQKVPEGAWYRYIFDLMQLEPKPKVIRFISLEGSGWPEREGWVREVHLIKTGVKQ
jgi:hypothetical protein